MCAHSEAQLFLFIFLFFIAIVWWLQALFHLVSQISYLAGSAVLIVGRSGLHVCFLHSLLHSNNRFLLYMITGTEFRVSHIEVCTIFATVLFGH